MLSALTRDVLRLNRVSTIEFERLLTPKCRLKYAWACGVDRGIPPNFELTIHNVTIF